VKGKFIIRSEEHRQGAIEAIRSLELDPVHELVIRPYHKDRSAEQNSLYWKWLTVIGDHLGEPKDALHETYKDRWLVSIYERDNPDYAEMIQALRAVWHKGMKTEAVNLRKKVVAMTSTTTATVKQMNEYMTSIERHAAELGVRLPFPEDQ